MCAHTEEHGRRRGLSKGGDTYEHTQHDTTKKRERAGLETELETELKLEREYSDQLEEEQLGDEKQRSNSLRQQLLEAQDNQAEAEANEQETADENHKLHPEKRRLSLEVTHLEQSCPLAACRHGQWPRQLS